MRERQKRPGAFGKLRIPDRRGERALFGRLSQRFANLIGWPRQSILWRMSERKQRPPFQVHASAAGRFIACPLSFPLILLPPPPGISTGCLSQILPSPTAPTTSNEVLFVTFPPPSSTKSYRPLIITSIPYPSSRKHPRPRSSLHTFPHYLSFFSRCHPPCQSPRSCIKSGFLTASHAENSSQTAA